MTLRCPRCGNGEGTKICGHLERGVYDGVLWWECWECGWAWPREFGKARAQLANLAHGRATEHNTAREQR